MINDLYYIKYLKYKKKYLNEKNKIGGGCENKNTVIQNKLEELDLLNKISSIFGLLQGETINDGTIISMIEEIYNKNVFGLIKLDKECLKIKLIENLSTIFNQLATFKDFKFSNGVYKCLNIKKGEKDIFLEEIDLDNAEFARGTSFITKPPDYKSRNTRYLTNLINIKTKYNTTEEGKSDTDKIGGAEFFIESMRFGTPLDPGTENFYENQIDILKKYVSSKKCIFISLLDVCDHILCNAEKAKVSENDIIKKEINDYSTSNTVYFNMSCNNNVNMPNALTVIGSSFRLNQNNYFIRLSHWIDESRSIILKKLRDNTIMKKSFFERFKENVLDNNYDDEYLVSELSIKKFVVKQEIKTDTDNPILELILKKDKEITKCEVDLTKENIRLVMFCYISLIFYFLSRENPDQYILLYHCKSGQDRTGTFYAINQMVNEITTKYYSDIVNAINFNINFLDIFRRFYSLIRTPYKDKEMSKNEYCYDNLEEQQKKITDKKKTDINKEVESCYLKYLLYSYNITLTSTGCPGLKWGLGSKKAGISLSNNFPYLLLTEPYLAILFEGASSMRGS
jgi:hypothetical protein